MEKSTATFLRRKPKGPIGLGDMYRLPVIYGSAPTSAKWSPDNRTLAFLWNEEGDLRRDVYLSRPDGSTAKLTDAAAVAALPVEDDERPAEEVTYADRMDPGVTAFEWAPDGSWIAYLCRGNLFRIPVSGGGPIRLTQSSQTVSNLQVSDNGRYIGFTMGSNVWAYDTEGGSLAQLTFFAREEVSVERYSWSPDTQWVAVIVEDRGMYEKVRMPDYSLEKEVKVKELRRNNVGKPLSKMRVGIVAPALRGKMTRIPLPDPSGGEEKKDSAADEIDSGNTIRPQVTSWTWDSSRLLVAVRSSDYKDWRLYAVTPGKEDAPIEICREYAEPWFSHTPLPVSPDSRYAYFLSYRTGWQHIYRVPIAGGEVEPVTQGEFDVTWFQIPKKGTRLLYTANTPDPREQHVFAVDLGGGEPEEVSPDFSWCDVAASEDGSALAFTCSQVMVPPEIYSTTSGSAPARVTTSPRPDFAKIKMPKVERFSFVNKSDGATVYGKMLLPHDFDPSKKHPVVLTCVYAGLGKLGFGRYQVLDTYMANEMGYILVGIDLRATMGYGRDFFYGYHKKLGIIDAEECVSCAEHLRTLPYVDGDRIGIWGGSYGGFLTLMVMCNPAGRGVFHTGVSWKPVTDWRNYWDSYTAERLGRPKDDPEVYKATSPVFHAGGLEGNLLLVHGMQDDNVLFQDAVWMVQKLVEAGKYFDLMIYPRDDHMLGLRHESLPDCMERIAAYFEQHMGLGPL
jgi:dipeptidyl-peptidase-4